MSSTQRNSQLKNRDVIPDKVMKDIKEWLEEHNKYFLLACYILHYLFVRPKEMSFLKVGDFSIKNKTLTLHGSHTKNHNDATLTLPDHVLRLMIDLNIFAFPSNYFLLAMVLCLERISEARRLSGIIGIFIYASILSSLIATSSIRLKILV